MSMSHADIVPLLTLIQERRNIDTSQEREFITASKFTAKIVGSFPTKSSSSVDLDFEVTE